MTPDQTNRIREIEHAKNLTRKRLGNLRTEISSLESEAGRLKAQLIRLDNELAAVVDRRMVG